MTKKMLVKTESVDMTRGVAVAAAAGGGRGSSGSHE